MSKDELSTMADVEDRASVPMAKSRQRSILLRIAGDCPPVRKQRGAHGPARQIQMSSVTHLTIFEFPSASREHHTNELESTHEHFSRPPLPTRTGRQTVEFPEGTRKYSPYPRSVYHDAARCCLRNFNVSSGIR